MSKLNHRQFQLPWFVLFGFTLDFECFPVCQFCCCHQKSFRCSICWTFRWMFFNILNKMETKLFLKVCYLCQSHKFIYKYISINLRHFKNQILGVVKREIAYCQASLLNSTSILPQTKNCNLVTLCTCKNICRLLDDN